MDGRNPQLFSPAPEAVFEDGEPAALGETTFPKKRHLSDESPTSGSSKKQLLSNDNEQASSSSRAMYTPERYPHLMNVPRCSLRKVPDKGWGLFAEVDIKEGEEIITERPVLVLERFSEERKTALRQPGDTRAWHEIEADNLEKGFQALSKEWKEDILSLHNARKDLASDVLGIFWTNSFGISMSPRLSGIYFFCSNLNHSCDPNCCHIVSYIPDPCNHTDRTMVIIADRDIKAGDELTICYIDPKMVFEKRQDILLENYGFKCNCSRCVLQGDGIRNWPLDEQRGVRLHFRPQRPRASGDQGCDYLTVIQSISSDYSTVKSDEIIWKEVPLILLTSGEVATCSSELSRLFSELPGAMRNEYLKMYYGRFEPLTSEISADELMPEEFAGASGHIPSNDTLFKIWAANSFCLDNFEGVFPFVGRLNHSCNPTCRIVWHPDVKTANLVANGPLEVGDEITICYNRLISGFSSEQGRDFLKRNYGIDCFCSKCLCHLSEAGPTNTDESNQGTAPGRPAATRTPPKIPKETALRNQRQRHIMSVERMI